MIKLKCQTTRIYLHLITFVLDRFHIPIRFHAPIDPFTVLFSTLWLPQPQPFSLPVFLTSLHFHAVRRTSQSADESLANTPQRNQEPLVIKKDKNERPQVSLGEQARAM